MGKIYNCVKICIQAIIMTRRHQSGDKGLFRNLWFSFFLMFIKIKWSHKKVSYGYISLWSLVLMETGENTQCNLRLLIGEVAAGQGHPRVLLPFLMCLIKRAWEVLRLDLQVLGLELRNENQHLVSILGLSLIQSNVSMIQTCKMWRCISTFRYIGTWPFFNFKWIFGILVETDPVPRRWIRLELGHSETMGPSPLQGHMLGDIGLILLFL